MRTHLHRWLPTALALLALVVAAGGPAEAKTLIRGSQIKAETVTSKQLKNGSVTAADLAAATLTGAQVADGSLTGADLADGSVGAADLADGAVGPDQLEDDGVGPNALAPNSLQGRAFDASGFADLNFGSITHGTCTTLSITPAVAAIQDGTLLDDAVVATPSSFFAGNFTYSVKTQSATEIQVKMCNISATDGDPDGTGAGKTWRWVAIDLN
jgi:hypothetical protein